MPVLWPGCLGPSRPSSCEKQRCIRGKDVLIQRELSDCRPTTDGRRGSSGKSLSVIFRLNNHTLNEPCWKDPVEELQSTSPDGNSSASETTQRHSGADLGGVDIPGMRL